MTLWRISNHADLSGEGGKIASARWHTQGSPIVYLASSPAAALLETLAHQLSLEDVPASYQWLEVVVEPRTRVDHAPALPSGWHSDVNLTRAVGDAWLQERRSALLEVPSAIVPKTSNYLLSPRHPDARHLRIVSTVRHPVDERLLKR